MKSKYRSTYDVFIYEIYVYNACDIILYSLQFVITLLAVRYIHSLQ